MARREWPAVVLAQLPDRVVVWALCAAVATAITVQLEIFHPYTTFPLFAALVAAGWKLCPRALGAGRAPLAGSAVALLVAVVWLLANWHYFAELIAIARDPGVYTLRGFWLMNHPSPDVTLTQQLLDLRKDVPQAGLDFGGETGRLTRYFQSTTVVPGLIAVAGWIGGPSLLMHGNLLIGAVALLAVYAVGRRLAGPLFALVPMIALAISMPMVSFSRVAYTEPLSLIASMACLLGLIQGVREGRRVMWLLAGAGAGGVALARIDGSLVVVGAVAGFVLWGAFATTRAGRSRVLRSLGWFAIPTLVIGGLGLTDLIFHSPDYLAVLKHSAYPLIAAVPALMVVAVFVTLFPGMLALSNWLARHPRGVAIVAVGVVGLLMVVMLLRPLLYQSHLPIGIEYQNSIAARQRNEGTPVDGTRTYDEQSLTWMAWYLGWPTVLLACAGGLWAIWVVIRKRNVGLLLVVTVIAVNSMLYLNWINITPDQIWAMRRFLPVILPGGLLLVGWLLSELYRARVRIGATLTPGLRDAAVRTRTAGVVVVVVAVGVSGYPAITWRTGLFTAKEGAGQYDMVEKICTDIQDQKVLLLGANPPGGFYQPTFRNLCNSSVITLSSPTPAMIAEVMKDWGNATSVKVVTFDADGAPWTGDPGAPEFVDNYQVWESVLSHRPHSHVPQVASVWIGTARADGMVVPA